MATMIPTLCDPASVDGEQYLFKAFEKGKASGEWVVFHSMKLANHPSQLRGESDFVALIPHFGVLVIEVKSYSGEIRADYNNGHRKDPLEQVQNETISIRHYLESRADSREFKRLPFVSLVIYPFGFCRLNGTAYSKELFLDAEDFERGEISEVVFERFKLLVADVYDRLGTPARKASEDFCGKNFDALKNILTSSLGFYESPQSRMKFIDETIVRYTAEQDFVVKSIQPFNKRIVLTGLSGTGKTIIAAEIARLAADKGRKILFLCMSDELAEYLKFETKFAYLPADAGLPQKSAVATFKTFLKGYGAAAGQNASKEDCARAAQSALEQLPSSDKFDMVILDEMQDIISLPNINAVGASLKGGLANGSWIMLGDAKLKSIFETFRHDEVCVTLSKIRPAVCELFLNCRNPKSVLDTVRVFGPDEFSYDEVARPDDDEYPVWRFYNTQDAQQNLLADTLKEIVKKVPNYSEIVILSSKAESAAAYLAKTPEWAKVMTSDLRPATKIRYAKISDFAGLEAMAIILTDLSDISSERAKADFARAATRSKYVFRVLADSKIKGETAAIFNQRKTLLKVPKSFLEKMFKNLNI